MAKPRLSKETIAFLQDNPSAVICLETGQLFRSALQAAKKMNVPYSGVNAYLRGARSNPVRGYTFEFVQRMVGRVF